LGILDRKCYVRIQDTNQVTGGMSAFASILVGKKLIFRL